MRRVEGADGRSVLQMRVDMGILQLETTGRPDGVQYEQFDTYYDYLVDQASQYGKDFRLDEEQCVEIDREFYQFYHRRICWLTLKAFDEAARDASHTLALMDFCAANVPEPEWVLAHEQYRPFVMFHKIQATTLMHLEKTQPKEAMEVLDEGLNDLGQVFEKHEAMEHFEENAFVVKLREMRKSVVEHYDLGPTLAQQLAEAISAEQYELAAKLRDRIAERPASD